MWGRIKSLFVEDIMGDKKRDIWSKGDIIVKGLSALLLPLVIFCFTRQQQQASEERLRQEKAADLAQRNADRTANLLKNLASDNKRERLLAINLIGYFADSEQLPSEVKPVLISTFLNDDDLDVKEAATRVLAKKEFKTSLYFEAQLILKDLKYYNGEISGLADQGTRDAVIKFQKDNEMIADGILGPQTLQKLRKEQQARQARQ
ncbi:MAG: peptidoglycan-binding protein [Microcystis aeruginosa LG13-03]|nr:peptidoglycan-binding protein [Microcystis aeruginosa LG13-13]NCR05964.1 peptidoglycan-binding protein [Microcystis aeruginosa LG13-03]NCR64231.1 peptidoglycan-binding protein [Microcystis aeruginosa LG11-05]